MTSPVLQLTPSYPPVVGGIEDHVANVVQRLPKHGYEPIVLTPQRTGEETGSEEHVYRQKSWFSLYKSRFAPGLIGKLLTVDYDLIHVHAPFHFGFEFAVVASRLRSVPLVVTVHMYDARDSLLYQVYQSVVYDRCLDASTVIIPTTMDYIDGYPVFESNREKLRPIPLGVDVERFAPHEGSRAALGLNEEETVLLFVGAMEQHHFYKDLDLLIEAFARSDTADRLLMVGSGDRVPGLREKAEAQGVAEEVLFPGYVSDADLPTYYSAADLFVLPSKSDRGEAFGIVLLEAMACGTPVLTTDIPGVRSVVGDGGLVVPPGSLSELVRGIDSGLEQAHDGVFKPREHVISRYRQSDVVARISNVYDEVLTSVP